MSGKKACFYFPECRLAYTKVDIKNEIKYRIERICNS